MKIYLEERPSDDWVGDLSVTIRFKPRERILAESLRAEIEVLRIKEAPHGTDAE